MDHFDYYYRAAWNGELPNERLDELCFGRDLEGAKAFAQAKSVQTGWCEVVTLALPMGRHNLPVSAIMYEHGEQVHAHGLMG